MASTLLIQYTIITLAASYAREHFSDKNIIKADGFCLRNENQVQQKFSGKSLADSTRFSSEKIQLISLEQLVLAQEITIVKKKKLQYLKSVLGPEQGQHHRATLRNAFRLNSDLK